MEKDLQVVGFRIGNETYGVRIAAFERLSACRKSPPFLALRIHRGRYQSARPKLFPSWTCAAFWLDGN